MCYLFSAECALKAGHFGLLIINGICISNLFRGELQDLLAEQENRVEKIEVGRGYLSRTRRTTMRSQHS